MKIEIKNRNTLEVIYTCEAASLKEAVEKAVSTGVSLCRADLSYANLRKAWLSSADLRSADLSGADLSFTDLSDADLSGANLRSADLSDANLSGADLSFADLDFTNIPMWCGTLKGVKVDFRLICQMLLHVFALECEDKRFATIKKFLLKYVKLSDKWQYYIEKHTEEKNNG